LKKKKQWIFAWWAVLSIGAICVPLNAWLTGEELSFAIGDSEPKVIFADVERLDRVQQHLGAFSKSVKSIITTRAPNAAALQQYAKSSVAIVRLFVAFVAPAASVGKCFFLCRNCTPMC